jgi:hypothetical protein
METIIPTPQPSAAYGDYSGKATLTSANFGAALASIIVPSESFPNASLVTPNFIAQQELCYTGVHQAGTAAKKKKQLSLIASAVSALTREQPAFTPRPGKNTFSKSLISPF